MELQKVRPADIEKRSFEIITEILGDRQPDPAVEHIVKRVIHTTADFDYAENLFISPDAEASFAEAIQNGGVIITDTKMALSGVSKPALAKFGAEVQCFISDPDVAAEAKEREITRAAVCMEKAAKLNRPLIFALGNAPTALVRVCELIKEGTLKPALVIGVPVGFVNVIESKEMLMETDVPKIVARGRKGGSNVAAAICNAMLYHMGGRRGGPAANSTRP